MSDKCITLLLICLLSALIPIGGCGNVKDSSVINSEKYPTKPITMIVPYAVGGSVDILARAMDRGSGKHLGQPLVILNKPGGGAIIGWNELAGAKPDGYTIGIISNSALLQPLYGPTRYNYPTALEPLVQVVDSPMLAVVSADQPWENITDVVNYAKQHPGEIKYGHSGFGTVTQIIGEMLIKTTGIDIAQIPFNGEAESLTALLGGHAQLIFVTPTSIKEYMNSGKVKVLAVAREKRLIDPRFKNIPTFKEQGLDIVFNLWYGIGAPKGLPKEVQDQLTEKLKALINDPEVKKNMENLGMTVEYLEPQEFRKKWCDETLLLTKIIKETGIADRIAAQKATNSQK